MMPFLIFAIMPRPFTYFATVLLSLSATVSFAQKEKAAPVSYDDKLLYGGCWFVPHNAVVNIRFTENSNFQLQEYDNNKGGEVTYAGKYLLDGNNLWLLYNDKPKQKFYFYKGEGADDGYYIKGYPLKTTEYYFVHGKCE